MSARTLLLGLILGISLFIYSTGNAAEKVKVKVVMPSTPYVGDAYAFVLGAFDNQDGTSTLLLQACDATIELTVTNEALAADDPEIQKQGDAALDKACGAAKNG
jgi:hypothetical protein